MAAGPPANGRRTILDCQNETSLALAVLARSEDGPASDDDSVNQAFDGFGVTRQFYKDVYNRDSIDDRGMRLQGYVHRGRNYNNAFWDGQEMVFGDGDGLVFTDFTKSLDVIAHELAHGVTEYTSGFEYHNQSGALNEHMSDAVGAMVKQWSLQQTADEADWLIGSEVFTPAIDADALRSMKAPGKAYDNELLGRDPQPDHMSKFVHLPDTDEGDNGGVHINSGIPNKRSIWLPWASVGTPGKRRASSGMSPSRPRRSPPSSRSSQTRRT
jgi:Zn-dependent metalloprotease